MEMELASTYRAGYVAIVGEPNVGKSTLLNALLNQKLSIVSARPQTTRQRVLGILSSDNAQIIFLDTPGLLRPKYLLHEKMLLSARLALQDADVVLLLTEVSRGIELPEVVEEALTHIASDKRLLLIINKVDTIQRQAVLPTIDHFARTGKFADVIPVSALKGENLPDLLRTIEKYLPMHPPFYPVDAVSEQPERFFAAELIREKIFEQFREEVPYSTAVEIVDFKEREKGKTFIRADIIVERDSQKGIVIGKGGAALKTIGRRARTDIEEMVGHPVFLELHVKVREKWRESESLLKKFGYSTDKRR
ncbi:MAG: GTPase Era [Ignavibacteria bacterium GWA2_54_16]|nr:MAG: GTPase Era [Ignavibacteria bacterium GWA2_54_16]